MNSFISFSGTDFLFRFFPAFLAVYYLAGYKHRSKVLFFGSLVFYAMGEPLWTPVLFVLTAVNACFAKNSKTSKNALIIFDVSLLALFRAASYFIPSFTMPLGVSFYILKMISYQSDLYHGRIEEKPGFWDVAAYFTAFMHIPQGPIARYKETVLYNREKHPFEMADMIEEGMLYIIAGLSLKLLLADRLGIMFSQISRIGYESISTPLAWLGAYGYSMQLYYDFWGYSLIAVGLGMMLGIPFIKNFEHPYAASCVADFYRRWHVSLGSFFKDYLYIPLGGNRDGKLKTIRNLVIVWIATGLWHGRGLHFMLWAGVLCLIIIWEKYGIPELIKKIPVIGRLHVLILIPLTWIIFAMPDMAGVGLYFSRLFPFFGEGINVNKLDILNIWESYYQYLICGALLCIPFFGRVVHKFRNSFLIKAAAFCLFWICIYVSVHSTGNTFLYIEF